MSDANLAGFLNVLEGCRHTGCRHLVYASSSSVYGANSRVPFRASDNVDHPLSLYGATKKANELMAHAYAHLFALPATGLRFFTVYGPWGRPDMAMWLFTDAIMQGRPIKLFNHGQMRRDFTYVDDVVEAVVRLVPRPAAPNPAWSGDAPDPATSRAPWHVYNIGNSQPVEVTEVVRLIEEAIGKPAIRRVAADAARRCTGDLCGRGRSRAAPSDSGRRRRSGRAFAASSIGSCGFARRDGSECPAITRRACNSLIQNVSTVPNGGHRQPPSGVLGRIASREPAGGPRPSWCNPRSTTRTFRYA